MTRCEVIGAALAPCPPDRMAMASRRTTRNGGVTGRARCTRHLRAQQGGFASSHLTNGVSLSAVASFGALFLRSSAARERLLPCGVARRERKLRLALPDRHVAVHDLHLDEPGSLADRARAAHVLARRPVGVIPLRGFGELQRKVADDARLLAIILGIGG